MFSYTLHAKWLQFHLVLEMPKHIITKVERSKTRLLVLVIE